jgi:hypothetical protein
MVLRASRTLDQSFLAFIHRTAASIMIRSFVNTTDAFSGAA